MEDVAPGLLKKIREDFIESLEKDKTAADLLEKINSEKGTYEDAGNFAERVGNALSGALKRNLSKDVLPDGKMYWNIADRVVRPMLETDYDIVSDAAVLVQEYLNKAANIGLKAQKAELNEDRVEGILNSISSKEDFEEAEWLLKDPVELFSRSVVDETLKKNVEFQGKAGLKPKIIRKAESKCCKWCKNLAGTYNYPEIPQEIYQRHENCRCTVEYTPGDGKRQDVWSKEWTSQEENAKIEVRKQVAVKRQKKKPKDLEQEIEEKNGLAYRISEHPKMFAAYTPKGLKRSLELAGYEVKPLGRGNFKGIPFEEGGGWRISYGGDRYIQYHPEDRSHHKGAYYKTSNGTDGTVRYDLNGEVKDDKAE